MQKYTKQWLQINYNSFQERKTKIIHHKLSFGIDCSVNERPRQQKWEREMETFDLHDYAFPLLSPRVVLLVNSVDEWIVFLVLFYKLAHPKNRQIKVDKLMMFCDSFDKQSSSSWLMATQTKERFNCEERRCRLETFALRSRSAHPSNN